VPRALPPLETFRFFEVAARHLNFTHAAEELHVTHGAVSQRVKGLEEHLGTPLFRRSGKSMLLTEEGRRLRERVQAAIDELAKGVDAIRPAAKDRILTISTAPCFAAAWLLPRLADFNQHHPDIQVNVRATRSHADFTSDGVDFAVRFGAGTWTGLSSIKLYDEELVPVCSPMFQSGRLPRSPEELLKAPLLHSERQSWSVWFEAVGLSYRDTGQGPRYGDEILLLPAAVGGLGVVLARASLVEAELKSGRLVRLFSRRVAATGSFFIVYPQGSEHFEKIQKFQQWLLEQARPVERESPVAVQVRQDVTHRAPRRPRHRYLATASSQ
jgi:LysR family transcriptional regulator, glycine cleavage system transcriptional activator